MNKYKLYFWSLFPFTAILMGMLLFNQSVDNSQLNVEDFGAIANDNRDDQAAIQETIDHAEHDQVEVVYIPEGTFQVNGPIKVGSNITLQLHEEATIVRNFTGKGSENATIRNKDFMENGNENIKLQGGTIRADNETNKGMHLAFWGVNNLEVSHLKVRGTHGDWTTIFRKSNHVDIHHVDIDTLTDEIYSDGIHVVGGKDIAISECTVVSADDSIALTIEDENDGRIEGVTVSDCTLTSRRASILKIMTTKVTTAEIENIKVSNITGIGGTVGAGQAIVFEDRSAQQRIKNISLSDIRVDASRGAGYGFFVDSLSGLELNNITISHSQGTGMVLANSEKITIANTKLANTRSNQANGMVIDQSRDINIKRTVIDQPSKHGIVINETNGPVSNILIENSTIHNHKQPSLVIYTKYNMVTHDVLKEDFRYK